mgnify:FL=1
MTFRLDTGRIFKSEQTPDGFLRVWMTVSRVGDLKYNTDTGERIEYVSPQCLFDRDSLDTAWGKPITLLHPEEGEVTADNARKHSRGMTQQGLLINSNFLTIVGVLTDREAIDAVQSGQNQVSAGYRVSLEPRADGKFNQKNRRYNHFSIVPLGRAGADVKIHADALRCDAVNETDRSHLDRYWSQEAREQLPASQFAGKNQRYPIANAEDVRNAWNLAGHSDQESPDTIRRNVIRIAKELGLADALPKTAQSWANEHNINLDTNSKTPMTRSIELNSVRFDGLEPDLAEAIGKLKQDMEMAQQAKQAVEQDMESNQQSAQAEIENLKGQLQGAQAKITELEGKLKESEEQEDGDSNNDAIAAQIKARLDAWGEVLPHLDMEGKEPDYSLDPQQIKRMYLESKGHNLEGKSEDYIAGLYEALKPSQQKNEDAIALTNGHLDAMDRASGRYNVNKTQDSPAARRRNRSLPGLGSK